jgi:hypothetical protein
MTCAAFRPVAMAFRSPDSWSLRAELIASISP